MIIRNDANGKSVIGALFRRERENPGPKIQVSSDAAVALGMLAGSPVKLNITALRREAPPAPEAPEAVAAADPAADPDALAADGDAVAAAVAEPPKKERKGLARLFGRKDAPVAADGAIDAAADGTAIAAEVAAAPVESGKPPRKGLFSRFRNKKDADVAAFDPAAEEAATLAADTTAAIATAPLAAPGISETPLDGAGMPLADQPVKQRKGLFGKRKTDAADEIAAAPVDALPLAGADPATADAAPIADTPKRKGLFGFRKKPDQVADEPVGAPLNGLAPVAVSAPIADTARPKAAKAPALKGGKQFVQVGSFGVEQNADDAASRLRADGVVPTVRNDGKTWRVLVGPATTAGDRDAVLNKVKALGFPDAYLVSG